MGIDLAVRAFEISVGDEAWASVAWPGDVDNVEVVFFDEPVEMDVDEVQARRGAPMTQEAGLDVLEFEWFLQ